MPSFKNIIAKLRSRSTRAASANDDRAPTANGNAHNSAPAPVPAAQPNQQVMASATTPTLTITLKNASNSSSVYVYVTGQALDNGNRAMFLQSDGRTIYYPASPNTVGSPLVQDVAIPLGAPGTIKNITIPRIAGGRVWFSIGAKLKFALNPGPGVVEPSVSNPTDPNINIDWGFCEFTYNSDQLFANISCVDFISIPVALTLTSTSGNIQSVPGLPANGLVTIINGLKQQAASDGRPWDKLVYPATGTPLRVLSPLKLLDSSANAWDGYWDAYVNQVWSRFSSTDMTVNTQAAAGNLTGRVSNGQLSLGSAGTFNKPNARDIWTCSEGPFATGDNAARNAVIPRLAAAFNRSTLLNATQFPNGSAPADYYKNATTNHYSRLVHQTMKDGRGYAFPYDDVVPDGGADVAGTVFDGSPANWTIAIGGS
ncbi:glycoside hydrolase family 64 protein [Karstenula rhodostoma CBS 690.94]|uniref:Glycoside hydrolase family 64 protein n=1 Tax=Karstenula rhodostoma CBS 690.94 TaxID=1392251 RepID=A0A9P4P6N0_9PLEO|nr:glycoside hydrolase family 64 protein [Karstenula rhodostoma CBS 690.94]